MTVCERCGDGPGSFRFGDALSLTHGGGQMWCRRCVLEVQLEHAKERAALIPEMESELAALSGSVATAEEKP